jgi:dolichol kinase
MTALVDVQPSIDGLLRSAAAELERFLDELHELSEEDDSWRAAVSARCLSLSDQLRHAGDQVRELRDQLASQHQRVCATIDEIRYALRQDRESLVSERDVTGLKSFRDALSEGLEALRAELKARRIDGGATLPRVQDRSPKLLRALFHVAMGLGCVALYQFVVTRELALWLLTGFVTFFGGVEVARRFSTSINNFWVDRVFVFVARPQERYRTNSATYYMLGLAAVTWMADRTVCCAAILVLALGDPIASAVGHRWGGYRFSNGKSLGGSLAFLLSTGLVLVAYFSAFSGLAPANWALAAACMALAGTVTELTSGRIDDNLAIPVVTAAVGMLILG